MCSTFKVLACAAVLAHVDRGQDSLDRRIRFEASDLVTYSPVTKNRVGGGMTLAELCEAGITQSDNTAGNLILASLGGPSGITAYACTLGNSMTRLDRIETSGAKLRAGLPGHWHIGDKTGGGDWGTTNDIAVIWPPDRKPVIASVYIMETKASFAKPRSRATPTKLLLALHRHGTSSTRA